jgi:hypothetical protein
MMRRFVLGVVVAVLAVSMAGGSVPSSTCDITFKVPKGRKAYLAVVDCKLIAAATWKTPKTAKARDRTSWIWYMDGSRLKSASGCGYLAYDLSGKDKRVFLVAKPGKNTEWNVSRTTNHKPSEEDRNFERWESHFTVAKGKLAGHHLCVRVIKPARKAAKGAPPVYQPVVSNDDSLPRATSWQEVFHK